MAQLQALLSATLTGSLEALLDRFGDPIGPSCGILGPTWNSPGRLRVLGPSCGRRLVVVLGRRVCFLEAVLGSLGALLARLGAVWEASAAHSTPS